MLNDTDYEECSCCSDVATATLYDVPLCNSCKDQIEAEDEEEEEEETHYEPADELDEIYAHATYFDNDNDFDIH